MAWSLHHALKRKGRQGDSPDLLIYIDLGYNK